MIKEKIGKLLDYCQFGIFLLILALVPLYFNIFTFLSFEPDKIILFRILVEIWIFVYLSRSFMVGKISFRRQPYFYLALFGLLLAQIIATIFSAYPDIVFWGSYRHQFGLFTYLHLYLFCFLVFNAIEFNKKTVFNILAVVAGGGFVAAVYGLMQVAGVDFLTWAGAGNGILNRASSTMGQPNYLASYLLLVLPLTAYLMVDLKIFYQRLIPAVFLLMQFMALIFTYSRAAWVGLVLVVIVFLMKYFYHQSQKIFWSIVISILLVLAGLTAANVFGWLQVASDAPLTPINRIKSLADIGSGSSGIRFMYYAAAQQIIKQRPVIGHGLDVQDYYFFQYYRPEYAIYEQINSNPDRAHNEILDILITTGALGLLAWIFLAIVISKGYYAIKDENNDLKKYLLFGLLACFVSLLFGFFTAASIVYFFVIVVMICALAPAEKKTLNFLVRPALAAIFLVLIFLTTIFSVWQFNLRLSMADIYYRLFNEQADAQNYKKAFYYLEQTFKYGRVEYYSSGYTVGRVAGLVAPVVNDKEKILMLESLKNIVLKKEAKYLTLEDQFNLAFLLIEIGRLKQNIGLPVGEFITAEKYFKETDGVNSKYARFFYYWGNLYFYEGRYDLALVKYNQALGLYPDLANPEINNEHHADIVAEQILVYKMIVTAKMRLNDWTGALEVIKKTLILAPQDREARTQLRAWYLQTKDYSDLIKVIKHDIFLNPNESVNYYYLAQAFELNKQMDKAREAIDVALKMEERKEYLEFLDKITKKQDTRNK